MERTDTAIRWDGKHETADAIAKLTGLGIQLQIEWLAEEHKLATTLYGENDKKVLDIPFGSWVFTTPNGGVGCSLHKPTSAELEDDARMARYQHWVNLQRDLGEVARESVVVDFLDHVTGGFGQVDGEVRDVVIDLADPVLNTLEALLAVIHNMASRWVVVDQLDEENATALIAWLDRFRWCGEPRLSEGTIRAAFHAAKVRHQRVDDPFAPA